VDEYQSFLYRGGMFVFCLNAAILIGCVCHPVSFLGKILSWKPLRWIGSRSYGIYLWHYPIIVLGTPVREIGNPAYWRVTLQLLIIFTIAELSYRFIEMPIRKDGFRCYFRQYFVFNKRKWGSFTLSRKISTTLIPLFLLVFFTGMTGVVGEEKIESIESRPTNIKIDGGTHQPSTDHDSKKEQETSQQDSLIDEETDVDSNTEQNTVEPKQEGNVTIIPPVHESYNGILAIGDSVMIDIATSLHNIYPSITIDAKIGRQVSQAVKLAPNYASFNQPDKAVIIQLGTNGYFTNAQIDTLLKAFSNADIYLVNTRVPRSWEGKVNRALQQKAQEYDNITLIDWHNSAINHPEFFAPDGVHLEQKGIASLTNLIQQAIDVIH